MKSYTQASRRTVHLPVAGTHEVFTPTITLRALASVSPTLVDECGSFRSSSSPAAANPSGRHAPASGSKKSCLTPRSTSTAAAAAAADHLGRHHTTACSLKGKAQPYGVNNLQVRRGGTSAVAGSVEVLRTPRARPPSARTARQIAHVSIPVRPTTARTRPDRMCMPVPTVSDVRLSSAPPRTPEVEGKADLEELRRRCQRSAQGRGTRREHASTFEYKRAEEMDARIAWLYKQGPRLCARDYLEAAGIQCAELHAEEEAPAERPPARAPMPAHVKRNMDALRPKAAHARAQEREEAARLRRLRQAKSAALQRQQEHALKAAQTKMYAPPVEPQPLRLVVAKCLEEWGVTSDDDSEEDDSFCGWRRQAPPPPPPPPPAGAPASSSSESARKPPLSEVARRAAARARQCHPLPG